MREKMLGQPTNLAEVSGVILAGGAGRRFHGQDKAWINWRGRPLIEHVVEAMRPQVAEIWISRHSAADKTLPGCKVCLDTAGERRGPLAGISSAMAVCRTPWLLVMPCDNPQPPPDLCSRLLHAHESAPIRYAHSGGRDHFLFALLDTGVRLQLESFLEDEGRAVGQWYRQQQAVRVDFNDCPQRLMNINTARDLQRLKS